MGTFTGETHFHDEHRDEELFNQLRIEADRRSVEVHVAGSDGVARDGRIIRSDSRDVRLHYFDIHQEMVRQKGRERPVLAQPKLKERMPAKRKRSRGATTRPVQPSATIEEMESMVTNVCPRCHGRGVIGGKDDFYNDCPDCDGEGVIVSPCEDEATAPEGDSID